MALPPLKENNPMNKHAPPKRAKQIESDEETTTEYYVPREQFKPHYKSYETQFDGTRFPIELSINIVTSDINKVNISNENDYSGNYQMLLQLYKHQLNDASRIMIMVNTVNHKYIHC